MADRMFPVMASIGGTKFLIPWAIGEEAWKLYAKRYGRDQSCERIAERGGFGIEEMDTFRPRWREFIVAATPRPA